MTSPRESSKVRKRLFVHTLRRARDWQGREEFEKLCRWWASGGWGLVALAGIGGAGKTATTERFLRVLPGVYPPHEDFPPRDELEPPDGVFVFSFYDAPNPEIFFSRLAYWMRGEPYDEAAERASYTATLELLTAAQAQLLLVMDGLELMQDDGGRGGEFGQVLDGSLRDFLRRVAEGELPDVHVIVTTRFRLHDPVVRKSPYYRLVSVDKLSRTSAVALLRARGVDSGSDKALGKIAQAQGYHALTVDLMGGFIARYCGGDPAKLPPEPLLELKGPSEEEGAADIEAAAVREQQHRFARLATRYRDAFAASDMGTLALLERVCLFRLGVTTSTLVSVFTGPDKVDISGRELAGLNERSVQNRLDLLTEMRLLECTEEGMYTVHPAVRDGFVSGIDASGSRAGHDAARQGLESLLAERPGEGFPSDPARLDLLEEIVYHAIEARQIAEAWSIYADRIGGYGNLGWTLALCDRGDRICRMFTAGVAPTDADSPGDLTEGGSSVFWNEWGLFQADLGQLDAAETCFERSAAESQSDSGRARVLYNLSEILVLRGRIAAGIRAAEQALEAGADEDVLPLILAHTDHLRATARGEMPDSFCLRALLYAQHLRQRTNDEYKPHGLALAMLIPSSIDITTWRQYLRVAEHRVGEVPPDAREAHVSMLIGARLDLLEGREQSAQEMASRAHDWAVAADHREVYCWSAGLLADCMRRGGALLEASAASRAMGLLGRALDQARAGGYSLLHTDLLLVRARLSLALGLKGDADRDALAALYGDETANGVGAEAAGEGDSPLAAREVSPGDGAGLPEILPAAHPECLYHAATQEAQEILSLAQVPEKRTVLTAMMKAARERGIAAAPLEPRAVPGDGESGEDADQRMRDFFISYTQADVARAKWIADTLEQAGYTTVLQARDMPPGSNFILEMHRAASRTDRTIAVLSKAYQASEYGESEWAAALAKDPTGADRKLVPVRVEDCEPEGLFRAIVYVDLVGLTPERATSALLGAFQAPHEQPLDAGGEERSGRDSSKGDPARFPGERGDAAPANEPKAGAKKSLETGLDRQGGRLQLVRDLNAVGAHLLNTVLFVLKPSPGLIPPMPAPPVERVHALLTWAEGPGGCGLAKVREVLDEVLRQD